MISADIYNTAGGPTALLAEMETGTRYRASAYATETDYGVVLGCGAGRSGGLATRRRAR